MTSILREANRTLRFALAVLSALLSLGAGAAAIARELPWATYNKTLDSERFSPLRAINRGNVSDLRAVCEAQVGEMGPFESGLLVIGRTIYVTTARTTLAIDAATCELRWRHVHEQSTFILNPSNRGAGYADGRIFRGTADGYVLALDASTGAEIWKAQVADPRKRELVNSAPIAWQGRLYVGTSGGDWGGQSRVLALDVRDGHELWRFNVIPRDGEPGAETWTLSDGRRRGGGAMWTSYTLDAAAGELFVATGNPAPALAADLRTGANLYTNSVVVLDAASGSLRWYFQAIAGDAFDYDLAAAPLLYRDAHGAPRVAAAGKDGNLYLIDRVRHRLLERVAVTTVLKPPRPTVEGVRACPGVYGGVEWNGPAIDPRTQTLFVGAVDMCMLYKLHGEDLNAPAAAFLGTAALSSDDPADSIFGWVTAVDGTTGRVRWRHRSAAPVIAGVTATAGGLVFTGDSFGTFLALDSRSGRVLREFATGATLAGGVVTYEVAHRQYVAYAAGGIVRGRFVREAIEPKVVIAALAPADTLPRRVIVPSIEPLPPSDVGASAIREISARRGAALYAKFCTLCHGPEGEGLGGPRLRGVTRRMDPRPLSEIIEQPRPAMARFYPGALDDADVADLAAFIDGWR